MINKIKTFLESKWFLPIFFLTAGVLWGFGQSCVGLGVIALGFILQFTLADNIRNIFGLLIFIPLFLMDLGESADWTYYIICISIAFASIVYFIIRKCVIAKVRVNRGKMFTPWIVSTIAFILGGVFTHFNILAMLGILGTSLLTYFFYFLAINFTTGLREHLAYTFIIGGLTAFAIYMTLIIRQGGGILYAIAHREFIWIGAENINTVAIFYTLAMISTFALGMGKRFDYLYLVLAVFFELAIFVTYCRLMILLSAIAFAVLFIIGIIKSRKKLNILWTLLAGAMLCGVVFIIWRASVIDIVKGLFAKAGTGTNGRSELWAWCVEAFRESPVFGYGFVAYEAVPGIREVVPALVLAHNTLLQWLTSIGIVGTLLMVYFYIIKYKVVFVGHKFARIFDTISILVVALSGMLDQSAIMDFFVYVIPFFLLADIENEYKEKALNTPYKKEDGKLNIGLFIDTFYPMVDGVITVVNNYAKRLCKKANVTVFCPAGVDKKWVDNYDYRVVRCKSIKVPGLDYVIPIPSWDGKFQDALEDAHLDIVHINSPFSVGMCGVEYAKRHGIPSIGHLHSKYKEDIRNAVKLRGITRIVLSIIMHTFNCCDICWPVNNGIGELFHKDYGVKTPMVMQQSGTDFTPVENIKTARKWVNEKYGLKDSDRVFCFVGRFTWLKNVGFIADALRVVKDKGVDFKMLYVGGGFDEEKLKAKVHDLGLDDCVIFTGRVTDPIELSNIYARTDLLLFPSPYDTDGLIKYEAACQHTPTLSVKGMYCASNITDNVNGYLSEYSVEAFADRIIEIFDNPKLYKSVCDGAYNDLYITWDACVEKAYQDYLNLIVEKSNKK